jgi:hypothetical protein
MSLIGLAALLFGISAWDQSIAILLQNTSAIHASCNSINRNNTSMICMYPYERYAGVTFDDLIQINTYTKINHNNTLMKEMSIYRYNMSMPFLLPFP